MPSILCVIPSRLGSTRLMRKPLADIQGKPMIQRVYENASQCPFFSRVIVATDHEEIADVVRQCGGIAEMTDPHLPNGSERVASVAAHYPDMDVVVNLQGDEPFVKPFMLRQLVAPYLAGDMPDMTTLAAPLALASDYANPGVVKVILDRHQNALYFSRAPIPYFRLEGEAPVYHHMGLYAYRRDFLLHYATLPQTPLELVESLEQLRVLENGYKIHVGLTTERSLEVNTPEELAAAQCFS